ncbi:MAG: TetR family transcriptional regulator [Acidimicrobiales bacterium]
MTDIADSGLSGGDFAAGADRFVEDLNDGVPIAVALEAANNVSASNVAHYPSVVECGTRMLSDTGEIDMKRLAAEAGVSRATLYRYYPDKSKVEAEVARIGIEGMADAARHEQGVAAKFRVAADYLVGHPGEAAAIFPFAAMVSVGVLGAVVEQITGDESCAPLLIGIAVMAATPRRHARDEDLLRRYIEDCATSLG